MAETQLLPSTLAIKKSATAWAPSVGVVAPCNLAAFTWLFCEAAE